ncbi:hypothetical protein ACIO3O_08320 [Streptomyces sp. NPDC087440]|uniref:hypothetical protein n=1 Tax=Streptomyces sp. NPDC087440 TaxID=3365790 RepID=UPI00381DC717
MPPPRTRLATFAAALAARLPGTWTSEYHHHAAYSDQFPLASEIWDAGHAQWALSTFVVRHDALLHGPDGQSLCVIDRPTHLDQFLVVPLLPDDDVKPHHFDGVEEPNGIKVANSPARAAATVARRLLPRYQKALATVHDNALLMADPVPRPTPPKVSQVLTLTRYADGALGAPSATVPEAARHTLYAHDFNHHEGAFLLAAEYGDVGQALRLLAVTEHLAQRGIGVNLRVSPPAAADSRARGIPPSAQPPHSITPHRRGAAITR